MTDRRNFLKGMGAAAAIGAGLVSRSALAALPESPTSDATSLQVPPEPTTGPWYKPVVTLNSWSLPWRMVLKPSRKSTRSWDRGIFMSPLPSPWYSDVSVSI